MITAIVFVVLCHYISCQAATVNINIISAGFNDGNGADIQINGKSIIPSTRLPSNYKRRGLYVATLEQGTGKVIQLKLFDTYGTSSENGNFQTFIQNLPFGTIVLMAVKDEASRFLDFRSRWLIEKSLGSRLISKLRFRDSWCLLNRIGSPKNSAYERFSHRYKGFSSLYIPDYSLATMRPPKDSVDIKLLSGGFQDKNTAGILVNGQSILSTKGVSIAFTRGIHIAVLNSESGTVATFRSFDTYGSSVIYLHLRSFLENLEYGQIVAIVVKDDASKNLDKYSRWLIAGFGSRFVHILGFRDSWCMIGRVGGNKNSAEESFHRRTTGISSINSHQHLYKPLIPSYYINVRIYSTGFVSGNHAAIFVNSKSVLKSGLNGALKMQRGLNVAIVDQYIGHFIDFKTFDTYSSELANRAFQNYVKNLSKGKIVLIAVKDEASRKLDASSRSLISRLLGSKLIGKLGFRDSWCMMGTVGAGTGTATESLQKKFSSFAEVVARKNLN